MARTYKWKTNPFQDYLLVSLLFGTDVSRIINKTDIYVGISTILLQFLLDEEDLMYLDFDIKKKNNYFRVVSNNIITALWLSGIFPKDSKYVIERNEYVMDDVRYKFNKKTKKLSYNTIN